MQEFTYLVGRAGTVLGILCGLLALPACGDSDDAGPKEMIAGSSGSGGDDSKGGVNSAGTGGKAGSSSGASSGGKATAGSSGSGAGGGVAGGGLDNGVWEDVSPPEAEGNVSAIAVNRLTGELLADVTDKGV